MVRASIMSRIGADEVGSIPIRDRIVQLFIQKVTKFLLNLYSTHGLININLSNYSLPKIFTKADLQFEMLQFNSLCGQQLELILPSIKFKDFIY